jgi:crotonobetaine/carnitine-CoA ligase
MNVTSLPLPTDAQTFDSLVRAAAARWGDRPAFEVDGVRLSFRQLDEQSDRCAAGLLERGIGRGDRICVVSYNCVESLLVWVAAAKIGALWGPLNASLEGDDLRLTIDRLDPQLIVADASTKEALDAVWDELAGDPDAYLAGGSNAVDGRWMSFGELIRTDGVCPPSENAPGDPLMVIYSGGTTGLPKGIVLPHFNMPAAGLRYGNAWAPRSDDIHFTTNQLYHQSTQHLSIVATLMWGVFTVLDRRFSLSAYWRRVRETRATLIDPIGTMVTLLVQQPPSDQDRQHHVRKTWNASSTLPAHVIDAFVDRFGIPMLGTYGLTDGGGGFMANNPLGPDHRPGSNGKGWDQFEFSIVDEHDRPLPTGEVGQIVSRPLMANTMALGYLGQAETTVGTWRNLWLHTGDLGRMDDDGYLYLLGRQAFWLRRRGENISAYEVEHVVSGCPGVAEVCVVGVPSELNEEDVKAFVIVEEGVEVTPGQIVDWCEGRITAFKIPRFVEFVGEFPRSASKREIEREKLKARPNTAAWDRLADAQGRATPR